MVRQPLRVGSDGLIRLRGDGTGQAANAKQEELGAQEQAGAKDAPGGTLRQVLIDAAEEVPTREPVAGGRVEGLRSGHLPGHPGTQRGGRGRPLPCQGL